MRLGRRSACTVALLAVLAGGCGSSSGPGDAGADAGRDADTGVAGLDAADAAAEAASDDATSADGSGAADTDDASAADDASDDPFAPFRLPMLTQRAFTNNALTGNPKAVDRLLGLALSSATADPYLNLQLTDALTRLFFTYLVSCALPPSTFVNYVAPTGTKFTFEGQYGFCPEWASSGVASNTGCQELVSACLLARQNTYNLRVPGSLRGHNSAQMPLPVASPAVPSVAKYKSVVAVASLSGCAAPATGLARDCGWTADGIGVCTPGTSMGVSTGCKAGLSDPPGADLLLRVCAGVNACDATETSRILAANDDSCGLVPQATFTCPAGGTFTVMWASYISNSAAVGHPMAFAVDGIAPFLYPAPQGAVDPSQSAFPYREGAFFGNIFGSSNLSRQRAALPIEVTALGVVSNQTAVISGAVYPNAFFCTSDIYAKEPDYGQDRVCGTRTADCAAVLAGSCPSVCGSQGIAPEWDFQKCAAPGQRAYANAITTFVNEPCAATFSASPSVCAAVPHIRL
jgi:hypothetical protein